LVQFTTGVPEPATGILLIFGMMATLFLRVGRRHAGSQENPGQTLQRRPWCTRPIFGR
jgi:hypothetical protein